MVLLMLSFPGPVSIDSVSLTLAWWYHFVLEVPQVFAGGGLGVDQWKTSNRGVRGLSYTGSCACWQLHRQAGLIEHRSLISPVMPTPSAKLQMLRLLNAHKSLFLTMRVCLVVLQVQVETRSCGPTKIALSFGQVAEAIQLHVSLCERSKWCTVDVLLEIFGQFYF